jgi:hypothetical protein
MRSPSPLFIIFFIELGFQTSFSLPPAAAMVEQVEVLVAKTFFGCCLMDLKYTSFEMLWIALVCIGVMCM